MDKCIICKSEDLKQYKHRSRENLLLHLYRCLNCRHVFQDPGSYVDLYTDGTFTAIARQGNSVPSSTKIKELDKKALERFYFYNNFIKSADSFIEVGSSIGSFLNVLRLNGKKVFGIEPDTTYAKFSQQQYGLSQDNKLIEEFKTAEIYDMAVSFHVIEHVKDPHAFVKKIADILQENGRILLECPSMDVHLYGDMQKTIWKPHIHYFTFSSMYYLLSQYFMIDEIGIYGNALFAYAKKSDKASYSKIQFKKYKSKSKKVNNLIKLTPKLKLNFKNTNYRQLILQPILQKNGNEVVKRYKFKSSFFIKNFLYLKKEKNNGKIPVTHISYYSAWENAGDTVLSKCVRDSFNIHAKFQWQLQKLTAPVTDKLIHKINQNKLLLIGGGGVLLPDSNKNNISGWQWSVSKKQLANIQVPLIVFAIGYNYFKKQVPDDFFIDNLKHLINKSSFFGLRNHGSITRVKELVGENLAEKIIYQPCPTTIIRKLHPEIKPKIKSKNVAINVAFDRYEKRFGSEIYNKLSQIALSMKAIAEKGYKIFNVSHLSIDNKFNLVLDAHKVPYQSINLQYSLPHEVYEFYNNMELVFGMRGHAQMIPFGLNCKIISLGTHNKIRYFLEDIDALDWYIDVDKSEGLKEIILETFDSITRKNSVIKEKIEFYQKKNHLITQENIEKIKKYL